MATLAQDERPEDFPHEEVMANEVRTEMKGSLVGAGAIAAVIAYLALTVEPASSPIKLGWFLYMALVLLTWAAGATGFHLTAPDDRRIIRFWIPVAKTVMRLCTLGIATSVWILLPPADDALRNFMIVLYAWYLIIQVLLSTAATRVTTFATVAILGSLILFAHVHDMPYRNALSVFLLMFGGTMIAANRFIRRAVLDATAARIRSEKSGEALARALQAVAAERDAKMRFLASASHDLQQPIQAARLFFDRALATFDPQARRKAATGATSAFASVEALLDTILVHLRLGEGAMTARPEEVDIDTTLRAVELEHGAAADAAGIIIRRVPTRLGVVADWHLLTRSLGNLVANAVRHSGGTRILLGARRRRDGQTDLWVIDDGRGVRDEEADRIFEDYQQGSSGAAGGFGIGLPSVRRMLRLQAGEAGVETGFRGGAAFFLRLPSSGVRGIAEDERGRCEAA